MRAIFQQNHRDIDFNKLPELLRPSCGSLGLTDYEKVFSPDLRSPGADVFDMRGIDRATGALVVVRPDQYIGTVLPLDARHEIDAYFDAILRPMTAAV